MSQTQFSFPLLENDELLQSLGSMELQIDTTTLSKPTYEAIRPVFEQLVIELTGVTREELMQPVFTAMDAFEYPELHDESIPCFNFFRQLSKLMLACGVKDFSWRDVFKPEPLRLKRNLSAIINFCKYRDEKVYAFEQMGERLAALAKEADAAEDVRAKNASELRRLTAEKAQQQQDVFRVEAEDQEVTQRNVMLNKQQATLQAEVRTLKQAVNQASDAASQAKFDLQAMEQEGQQLRDQVVQSPEKHRHATLELVAATEAQRLLYAQLGNRAIENDRKLEMIGKFEKEVMRCIKIMEELDTVITRKKAVSQKVKDGRLAINANERQLSEITSHTSTLRRHMATLSEKFQRLEHQAALKLEAAASCVEEQLRSREAVEAENAAIAARAAEDEASIRFQREHMAEMKAQHEFQVRSVLDKYAVLRKMVNQYNTRIVDSITSGALPMQEDIMMDV
ncbi:hypothetical protein CEUSTIGMA_g4290.t1 [Chlamydomonas eustigma]|uniref:Uncharacterized protein n=1 Tax=Chlamydomonas eustigma TaxID=1157962 RepID=A0A250X166_9CHLO|nr:hypothetical protein CEUSTIGMA_g4290.t1 [Chlamydomonas eustigma]|eukprot:GAX76844.1 hypothetical protein CEUSTIGMA_g4290.t1 [Chlamydomonas eustigma]